MTKVVKTYPAGSDSRSGAVDRSVAAKKAELVRRGSDAGNAAKHAKNMTGKQLPRLTPNTSTGDPNGTPSY